MKLTARPLEDWPLDKRAFEVKNIFSSRMFFDSSIGLMQKSPPIFKKMFLNDVALLWMRGFHAYDTASVS